MYLKRSSILTSLKIVNGGLSGRFINSTPGLSSAILVQTLVLFVALSHVSDSAWAAHAVVDLTDFSLEELMRLEVYSASKFQQKASDAPSAVTIITAQEIKVRGYRNLTDILRSFPGVYVNYDRNYSYVGVRGFSRPGDYNDRILFLLDGQRLNDNIYDSATVGFDFVLDVDLIERVEFLPAGPATALYGNNALFGVVSIVTKRVASMKGFEISAATASADTWQSRATFGHRWGSGAQLLLSATRYDSQGRNLYYPEFNNPPHSDGWAKGLDYESQYSLFSKLMYQDWSLNWIQSRRDKGIPTASFGQDFNDPRSQTRDEQMYVNLAYRKAWTPHLTMQSRLFYGDFDYSGHYIYDGQDNPDFGIGRWGGVELQWVNTAFDRHKLAFGGEYQHDWRRDQLSFDGEGLQYLDSRIRSNRWGLYVLDEFALNQDTDIGVGLRYDRSAEGKGRLDPRFSFVYRWDERTTLKWLYSGAFRTPNAYELYYYSADDLNKPVLQPETIKTYEFIVEKNLRKTQLSASVYHYQINHLIDLSINPETGRRVYVNRGRVKANGITLEGTRFWESGQRLRASYSWQHAENQAGLSLDNSPQHLLKLNWLQPLSDEWSLSAELQAISKRRTILGNKVPGVALANINLLGQPFSKNFDISLGVYNAFDQDYASPGGDEHVQAVIPQDGRTWRFKLDYRF